MTARPVLTFDIDGVLCRPPFGMNPGTGKGKRRDAVARRNALWLTERWRYQLRRPMPGAIDGFRALARCFDCKVMSARGEAARPATEAWFRRYFGDVPELHLRPHWRETAAQFKARHIVELGAIAHFEDDPFTAQWLAEVVQAVFLVDWGRNRWLEGANVHRIARLEEAWPALEELAGTGAGERWVI